jgi:hypothetical protein
MHKRTAAVRARAIIKDNPAGSEPGPGNRQMEIL